MQPIGIRYGETGRGEHVSFERGLDRALREQRMTVRTSATDFSTPLGRPAFLQGKVPGATSPKVLFAQARAVFGGVAPAPPMFRTPCASRPDRTWNSLPDKVFHGHACFAGAPIVRISRPVGVSLRQFPRNSARGALNPLGDRKARSARRVCRRREWLFFVSSPDAERQAVFEKLSSSGRDLWISVRNSGERHSIENLASICRK